MSRLEATAAATAASKPGSSSSGRGEGQARGTPPAAAPRLLGAPAPRPPRRPPPLPGLLCLRPLPGWRCRKLGRAAVAASSPERAGGRAGAREGGRRRSRRGSGRSAGGAGASGRGNIQSEATLPNLQQRLQQLLPLRRAARAEGSCSCSRGAGGGEERRGPRLTLLLPGACHLRGPPQPSLRAAR